MNTNIINNDIISKLARLEIMKENQRKATKAYYQRNKESICKRLFENSEKLKNDPEKCEKLRLKKHEYYQNQKNKDPEYLKKQYIQKKEKRINDPPFELSIQLE